MTVARYQESPKTRLFLFVSSLAPVFIIAGLRLFDAQWMLAVLLLVVGVVTFLLTPLVLFSRRKAGKQEFVVSNVKDESSRAVTDLSSRGYQVRARHSGLTENAGKHGLVWHHHQDTGRMQLINKEVHNVVRHTGGYAIWSKMLNV